MNTNETQLLNSILALAALSANISPEELKEYVNVLSSDSSKVRSDDRFSDADILRSAIGLLRVYRDESLEKMAASLLLSVCWKIAWSTSPTRSKYDVYLRTSRASLQSFA